jgi:hypothetical protein
VLLFGTAAANCCWLTAPAGLVLLLCCKLTTWETWRSVSLPRLHHPFLAPGRAPWVLGCPSSAPSSRCWTPGTRCSASRACSGVGQAPWLSAAPPQCRATQCRVVQCSQRVSQCVGKRAARTSTRCMRPAPPACLPASCCPCSGTLSYIFNELAPGKAFSEVVWGARRRGYTEPDPRDDLSGGLAGPCCRPWQARFVFCAAAAGPRRLGAVCACAEGRQRMPNGPADCIMQAWMCVCGSGSPSWHVRGCRCQ